MNPKAEALAAWANNFKIDFDCSQYKGRDYTDQDIIEELEDAIRCGTGEDIPVESLRELAVLREELSEGVTHASILCRKCKAFSVREGERIGEREFWEQCVRSERCDTARFINRNLRKAGGKDSPSGASGQAFNCPPICYKCQRLHDPKEGCGAKEGGE